MLHSITQISDSESGIPPIAGVSWSARLVTPTIRVRRVRRPSRMQETSEHVVQRAIPEGAKRPSHTDEWIAAVERHPTFDQARADHRRALRRCIEALVAAVDFGSMTVCRTWGKLAVIVECAERSIGRHLRTFREMGVLGVVASGRSAAYASVGEDGNRVNEAPVYVLCVPEERPCLKDRMREMLGLRGRTVDESVTPPSEAGLKLTTYREVPRTRTRNRASISEEQKKLCATVDQIRWNRHRVPSGRVQRRTAAWRVKSLLPNVLGRMSDRDVASCLRDFFVAGWSPDDVHHALESRPDGSRWPYAGAPDTKEPYRVRGWLRFRLDAWRDTSGAPMVSRGRQLRADDARRKDTQQALRKQQHREDRHRQADQAGGDSEVKKRALRRIREVLRRR